MFNRLKREDHDEIAFRMLLAFMLVFIPMRGYLYLEKLEIVSPSPVMIGDLHVHHFVFGITVLAIAGYASLMVPYFRRKIAWLYGAGLALAFDEFSMWLHLNDDYWTFANITALVIIGAFLLNVVYFKRLWIALWHRTRFVNPLYHFVRIAHRRVATARTHAIERMAEHLKM